MAAGQDPEGDTGSEASLAGWQSARRAQGDGLPARSSLLISCSLAALHKTCWQSWSWLPALAWHCMRAGCSAEISTQPGSHSALRCPQCWAQSLGAPHASWHSEDSLLCRAADQASLEQIAEQYDRQNQHRQDPSYASLNAAAQEADPRQATPARPDSALPAEASLQHTCPGPALSGRHGDAVYGRAETLHTGKQHGADRGVLPALEDDEAFDVGACAARRGQASSSTRRQALHQIKQTADALRVLAEANQQVKQQLFGDLILWAGLASAGAESP